MERHLFHQMGCWWWWLTFCSGGSEPSDSIQVRFTHKLGQQEPYHVEKRDRCVSKSIKQTMEKLL
jgi:hypothetical protein